MKRSRDFLKNIEGLVRKTYNRRNRRFREVVPNKLYNPLSDDDEQKALGYSWMYKDTDGTTEVYTTFTANLGPKYADTQYRIFMHEVGHIYLTHLSSDTYKELDKRIYDTFASDRGRMIDFINKNCNIDFGEDLINRVLDDPSLNHELHNIAMDMEVNSKILSEEDINEMEKDVSELFPKTVEERLGKAIDDPNLDEATRKKAKEMLDKLEKESKVKFMLPCRYKFPDGLSYPEYMMLIIKNLHLFIKMMMSIDRGGVGDIDDISDQELQAALGQGGMQSISDLMRSLGMLDEGESNQAEGEGEGQGQEADGEGQQGIGQLDESNAGGKRGNGDVSENRNPNKGRKQKNDGFTLDHRSPSRDRADTIRDMGKISANGGYGCSSGSGELEYSIQIQNLDPVDSAINEVMKSTKTKVIKRTITRDVIRNYNLGKIRTLIVPSIIARNRIDTKPKPVFIIDVSGSMNTNLISRIITTISKKMKEFNRGLRYDILTWSHVKGDWYRDIDPARPITKIRDGGGTEMADAMEFCIKNYDPEYSTFILCSDFDDNLDKWVEVLKKAPNYDFWGFNYGRSWYRNVVWPKNFKVRNFNKV